MTGDFLIDTMISLAGISFLVFLAWLIFPHTGIPVNREAALERAALDEPDFTPVDWLIDANGRAALASDEKGEFILVARAGADLLTRRFRAGGVRADADNGILTMKLSDLTMPAQKITGAKDAALWARKLTARCDR